MEPIRFAGLELRFLQDKTSTHGGLDLFTTVAEPGAGMPIPHYHEAWDETVFGLAGTSTWALADGDRPVGPGETLFIQRGAVHGFANRTSETATFLSILSPGVLGPDYFRETAALFAAGRPDPATMQALMRRYGLIPTSLGR